MLKHLSEVTLVAENIFFLKILNFVQSFVECKVSLADGNRTASGISRIRRLVEPREYCVHLRTYCDVPRATPVRIETNT